MHRQSEVPRKDELDTSELKAGLSGLGDSRLSGHDQPKGRFKYEIALRPWHYPEIGMVYAKQDSKGV